MMLVTKVISDLTDEEYALVDAANMGDYGQMRMELRFYRDCEDMAEDDNARAVMLLKGEELISWALLFGEHAYFYTHEHHRNKGYGTTVMREVKKHMPTPKVCPWTPESGGFFSKFNCIPDYGLEFLTEKPKVC